MGTETTVGAATGVAIEAEEAVVARLRATGVVPIVRAASVARGEALVAAVEEAGFDVVEVSFNTPDAAALIGRIRARWPRVLVGAGTVLRPEEAAAASAAGARFLLSPVFDETVDQAARAAGCLYIPGVFTAHEVWAAVRAGRRLVKLFPASLLGIAGARALLEPFGPVGMLPTGGLGLADVAPWRAAGAVAVGLGGALARAEHPVEAARQALAQARLEAAPA